ncbi:MAG: hypothetical protein ABUS57_10680 [Pseudomonadota bacterium]
MTYSFNRKRGVQALMGAVMLLLTSGFIGFGLAAPIHWLGYPFALFGVFVGYLAVSLTLEIFAPNPILRIDAEGVYFLPFSPATVPWRDITSVSMAQGYSYSTDGINKPDGKFGFKYAIRDPSAYPKRGGISGVERAMMVGDSVPLNTLTLIDAKWPDLLAAFRAHYPGKITEIPVPGFPPANP